MSLRILIFLLALSPFLAVAQSSALDKVFVLGEQEQRYEALTSAYTQSLLEASSNSITTAFEGWLQMQKDFEAYAVQQKYDLNGVRLWLHVFWAADGRIDNVGFLLRPDSKFVPSQEIKVLLAGFIESYRFPVQSTMKFSHYTGATFPTLLQRKTD